MFVLETVFDRSSTITLASSSTIHASCDSRVYVNNASVFGECLPSPSMVEGPVPSTEDDDSTSPSPAESVDGRKLRERLDVRRSMLRPDAEIMLFRRMVLK